MKRNWDTIRKIMLRVEQLPDEGSTITPDDMTGMDSECAFYHMRLLIESGLAMGGSVELTGGGNAWISRLSWDGHELLDKIRSDTAWNKIKETARIKGIDLCVDAVKAIAGIALARMVQG